MTENEIILFKHEEFGEICTLRIDGEPWFVGKEIAEVLGYGNGNANSKAIAHSISDHVDEDDKKHISYEEFKGYRNGHLKNISHYGMVIINESGLYSLILSSKLPSAKKFKRSRLRNSISDPQFLGIVRGICRQKLYAKQNL